MSAPRRDGISDPMLQRIYCEFIEMPGLRLTCRQAQRLWGLDEATCLHLLRSLVDAKFLCHVDHGAYARLTDGHAEYPRPRMARIGLDDAVPTRAMKAV